RSLQKFAVSHASVYNHFNQERSLSTRTNGLVRITWLEQGRAVA
ncbi:MAG: IS6 family transposase, partial [Roseobacter sp.]|nr:IS6 family transposase [Roseobacter sp.]